jgi:hypothetical protein
VLEPLRIERAISANWVRAGLDAGELSVGEGAAATVLGFRPSAASVAALDAWTSVLSDLRDLLENGKANYP